MGFSRRKRKNRCLRLKPLGRPSVDTAFGLCCVPFGWPMHWVFCVSRCSKVRLGFLPLARQSLPLGGNLETGSWELRGPTAPEAFKGRGILWMVAKSKPHHRSESLEEFDSPVNTNKQYGFNPQDFVPQYHYKPIGLSRRRVGADESLWSRSH